VLPGFERGTVAAAIQASYSYWRLPAYSCGFANARQGFALPNLSQNQKAKTTNYSFYSLLLFLSLLAKLIETLIQRDVAVYAKMTRLP
jgi:hypothetical protein